MIDSDVTIRAEFFKRWLTVEKFRNILFQLHDKDVLYQNSVGNLVVERDGSTIGYIDFNHEAFEEF